MWLNYTALYARRLYLSCSYYLFCNIRSNVLRALIVVVSTLHLMTPSDASKIFSTAQYAEGNMDISSLILFPCYKCGQTEGHGGKGRFHRALNSQTRVCNA
jgi:hypothetical protein